jgi:tetratricopeptide (TPR) repeat protein
MTDMFPDSQDLPIQLEALVEDSVDQILKHEDAQLFFSWVRRNFERYYTGPDMRQGSMFEHVDKHQNEVALDPDILQKLAVNFASMIWNGMPLPSNRFRPKPIAAPGRNDPCHCGSGKKYKQCCAQLPAIGAFPVHDLWPLIFEKLDKEASARAIRENHVPVEALGIIAADYLEADKPKKAVMILAPLFEGDIRKTKDDAEFAMTILCNAYDDLGYDKKKIDLLQAILNTVPKSPLRSGAWQRTATIRMDAGDADGAWQAFQHAQRDDPKSLSLGLLEVQILYAQGQVEKAKQRADFWVRQMRRAGVAEDEPQMEFMIEVSRDPAEAFAEIEMNMVDDAGLLLKQWLETVRPRALPDYSIGTDEPVEGDDDGMAHIRNKLRSHGLPEEDLEQAIQSIQGEFGDDIDEDEFGPEDNMPEFSPFYLQAPQNIQNLELEWHRIFPLAKPFSTHDTPFGDDDPWEVQAELTWANWLMEHPQAFDSVDILDDLATALVLHPQFGSGWLFDLVLVPILQRSEEIVDKAMAGNGVAELPWIIAGNRPALRALSRQVNLAIMRGDADDILQRAQKLLSINWQDNHGFRVLMMNQLICDGRDEEALELAQKFAQDLNPEVVFGKILVLYRQNRKKEAVQELAEALEYLHKVPRYLLAKRIKEPPLYPDGIQVGGDDQAWLYRESMRDEWLNTPGALEWLKSTQKVLS